MKGKLAYLDVQQKKRKLTLEKMMKWDFVGETFLSECSDVKKNPTGNVMLDMDYSAIKLIYISLN